MGGGIDRDMGIFARTARRHGDISCCSGGSTDTRRLGPVFAAVAINAACAVLKLDDTRGRQAQTRESGRRMWRYILRLRLRISKQTCFH